MRTLKDKRIIVAGSATGIGADTARRLAQEGARVHLGDVNESGAKAVAEEIRSTGGIATSGYYDLYDAESIETLVTTAVEQWDCGLDGLANVAADVSPATAGQDLGLLAMDISVWERTNRANLIGTALMMKHAIPHLVSSGGGSIVNVTSGATQYGEEIRVAYAASKAGINSITRHVARTHGASGVRANAVSPGAILTETALASFSEEMKAGILSTMPLSRHGRPDDIAGVIAFLLSDDTEWITGQVWSVNGGGVFRE
ncbi:SDR family NAD(P)-dependent oxidoreductase [Streptomyces sp. NPDC057199]|uniref:SDR family NAD(P)-dependent oxidoreductase n=1 Tax=Streptomyces sp. NPDC057199 TaxID=3346047 RepID=UPI003644B514